MTCLGKVFPGLNRKLRASLRLRGGGQRLKRELILAF